MLQAMNTGHDGSLTTIHSNSPRDTLSRIETMTLMAGFDLPIRAIREQMASAIDLIVHLTRLRDGTRRVTHVSEVQDMEGDVIIMQDLFLFDFSMGVDEHGRFQGTLKSMGIRPQFADKLEDAGHHPRRRPVRRWRSSLACGWHDGEIPHRIPRPARRRPVGVGPSSASCSASGPGKLHEALAPYSVGGLDEHASPPLPPAGDGEFVETPVAPARRGGRGRSGCPTGCAPDPRSACSTRPTCPCAPPRRCSSTWSPWSWGASSACSWQRRFWGLVVLAVVGRRPVDGARRPGQAPHARRSRTSCPTCCSCSAPRCVRASPSCRGSTPSPSSCRTPSARRCATSWPRPVWGVPSSTPSTRWPQRVRSDDFEWVVTAIGIQREVGGNLAELLDIVAETMMARARIRREAHTLTAEGRIGAVVISVLPVGIGFFVYAVNPSYIQPAPPPGLRRDPVLRVHRARGHRHPAGCASSSTSRSDMLPLAVIAIFVTATALAYAAAIKADERLSVRAARVRLGDYETSVVKREEDLKEPFAERVLAPTAKFVLVRAQAAAPDVVPGQAPAQARPGRSRASRKRSTASSWPACCRSSPSPLLWLVVWKLTSLNGHDAGRHASPSSPLPAPSGPTPG